MLLGGQALGLRMGGDHVAWWSGGHMRLENTNVYVSMNLMRILYMLRYIVPK